MDSTQAAPRPETPEEIDTRLNKDVAAFSYIWVMSLVVYAARKNSPFAQYHSKQGIILFVLSFVWIIPVVGQLLALFVVMGMVLGFIHAAQGQRKEVPFVGPLSRGEFDFTHLASSILKAFEEGWRVVKAAFTNRNSTKAPGDPANHTSTNSQDLK